MRLIKKTILILAFFSFISIFLMFGKIGDSPLRHDISQKTAGEVLAIENSEPAFDSTISDVNNKISRAVTPNTKDCLYSGWDRKLSGIMNNRENVEYLSFLKTNSTPLGYADGPNITENIKTAYIENDNGLLSLVVYSSNTIYAYAPYEMSSEFFSGFINLICWQMKIKF